LVKTKQLLREKVWFPNIDGRIKLKVEQCVACQANSSGSRPDPLQMSPLPPEPWHTVHVDFCGPFPTGEYLFVVIDAYSRFPEVEVVHSTAASGVIPKLDRIFATHGLPRIIRSDNGPPFNSEDIRKYMAENGINLSRITPLWPQANSEAENFMKPMTKAIRSAHAEGKPWKKHFHKFLLNYRSTPHCTTGFTPAELLFNRKVRNKLPHLSNDTQFTSQEVEKRDEKAKAKMKAYADAKARAAPSEIAVGDLVLARQRKQSKLSTPFDPRPFRVIRKKGTMVTACRSGKYITHNASYFKLSSSMFPETDVDEHTDVYAKDDDMLEAREQNTSELDCSNSSVSNQGTSSMDQSVTSGPRRSQRSRRPVKRFGHEET